MCSNVFLWAYEVRSLEMWENTVLSVLNSYMYMSIPSTEIDTKEETDIIIHL